MLLFVGLLVVLVIAVVAKVALTYDKGMAPMIGHETGDYK